MKHKHIETPWGPSQSQHEHAPGIVFHSTASHGGYHLSTERWKDFTAIPQFANWPAPWLEEDCDACLVYLRWPELATNEQIHDAVCMARTVASWDKSEQRGHDHPGRWVQLVAWLDELNQPQQAFLSERSNTLTMLLTCGNAAACRQPITCGRALTSLGVYLSAEAMNVAMSTWNIQPSVTTQTKNWKH